MVLAVAPPSFECKSELLLDKLMFDKTVAKSVLDEFRDQIEYLTYQQWKYLLDESDTLINELTLRTKLTLLETNYDKEEIDQFKVCESRID